MVATREAINDPSTVHLAALCAEYDLHDHTARYRLRKAKMRKHDGAYCWPVGSDELKPIFNSSRTGP